MGTALAGSVMIAAVTSAFIVNGQVLVALFAARRIPSVQPGATERRD